MINLRTGLTAFVLFQVARGQWRRHRRTEETGSPCPAGMTEGRTEDGLLVCFEPGGLGRQFYEPAGAAWGSLGPLARDAWTRECLPCKPGGEYFAAENGRCEMGTLSFEVGECMGTLRGYAIPSTASELALGPAAWRSRRERFAPPEEEGAEEAQRAEAQRRGQERQAQQRAAVDRAAALEQLARESRRQGKDAEALRYFEEAGDALATYAVPGSDGTYYRQGASTAYRKAAGVAWEIMSRLVPGSSIFGNMQARGGLLAVKAMQLASDFGVDWNEQRLARDTLRNFGGAQAVRQFDRAERASRACVEAGGRPEVTAASGAGRAADAFELGEVECDMPWAEGPAAVRSALPYVAAGAAGLLFLATLGGGKKSS
jgi:hypothetical protein